MNTIFNNWKLKSGSISAIFAGLIFIPGAVFITLLIGSIAVVGYVTHRVSRKIKHLFLNDDI